MVASVIREVAGNLISFGIVFGGLSTMAFAASPGSSLAGEDPIIRIFELGHRPIEGTTGNFCTAKKFNDDASSHVVRSATFYILNGFEDSARPLPDHVRVTVQKNDRGATVVFHPTADTANIKSLSDAIGPFMGFPRSCDAVTPLWTRQLKLQEVTMIAFDGLEIVKGPNGPEFRRKGGGKP